MRPVRSRSGSFVVSAEGQPHLVGGGGMLAGFAQRIASETEIPVHLVDTPLEAGVRGAGRCIAAYDDGGSDLVSDGFSILIFPEGEISADSTERSAPSEPEAEESARTPGWLMQVPYLIVLATMGAGIVIVAAAYFKRGPALIAGALLLAAVFRALLPPDQAGMLAGRSRLFDVSLLTGLALLLVTLAWVAPQL
jgi:hypothetical protein